MSHKLAAIAILLTFLFNATICAEGLGKVTIKGNNFIVDGKEIFMNGVNTPWDKWNDFGGAFDEKFWDSHFAELHKNGINSSRIWISCNGQYVEIDKTGKVVGPTDKFWEDTEKLLEIAEKNGIYIMATLMSFDNFKDEGQDYMSWRKLFDSEENMDSMVDNYVIPFVQKFQKYNSLWSIDLCNEPDWINENDICGRIEWEKINTLFAKETVAIHENSDVLVTIGFGMIKYTSDKYQANYGDDDYLRGLVSNDKAAIDFDSVHFYEWEAEWFGFPFDRTPVKFGLSGKKPAMIGEFPAFGFTTNTKNSVEMSADECYVNCYGWGWNGLMAWTSNGVDTNGKLADFVNGANKVAKMVENGEEKGSFVHGGGDFKQQLGKVTVEGTKFMVDGKEIFMNGVNTPWDKWNDFGGAFDEKFWDNHFAELHKNGINSSRIWISCNGLYVHITSAGKVKGPTEQFWEDVERLLQIADKNGIYVMATLMSFDNFKDEGQDYMSWRKLLDSESNMDSMVENYVVPFVQKFKNYNSLWSIDLCNEPDWIHENDFCGQIEWEKINKLFAKEAAAIHENSDVLVTVGFGMIKYTSKKYEAHYGADSYLKELASNPKAYYDFDSPHFYEWEAEWFGFPFDTTPIIFGLDGTKPAVIGEFPATGFTTNTKNSKKMSGSECYTNAFASGWNGLMAWTSNGVDNNGKLQDFVEGARKVAGL